jgi:hypothetical protein
LLAVIINARQRCDLKEFELNFSNANLFKSNYKAPPINKLKYFMISFGSFKEF